MLDDSRWIGWLALHLAVGVHLGWQPHPGSPFAWLAADSGWRARTVRRARGQLSHQPPATAYCAEIWQVVLSELGLAELRTAYPRAKSRGEAETAANTREGRAEETRITWVAVN